MARSQTAAKAPKSNGICICAALLAILFMVLFCFSGITATTTVKDTTVSTAMSLPELFFSLSSASILLIPLSLVTMIAALIFYLAGRKNTGFMFATVSFITFVLFVVLFSAERKNPALYNVLSEQLKEAGVKFKKRDVENIIPSFKPMAYAALAAAGLSACIGFPNLKSDESRVILKRELQPYAFIAPHLLFFIVFFITPAVYGIYAAFTKWDLYNEPVFIGLENFKTLLFDSGNTYYKQLRNGLGNTFKFVIYSVPFCILLPLTLALALQQKTKGNKFFQALYYFPSLLSITTVTLTCGYMFRTQYGVVTKFLGWDVNWFAPPYSWIMLVVITVWWCNGGNMVIYQSALASVPTDLYEAASVDGANAWEKFLHVTLPGISYPLSYTLITSVIAQFNIYGQPLILTGFGNNEANAVLLMYIQENAVKKQVAGMSAAMALILGLCIMVVSAVQLRVMRRNNT